MKKYILSSLAVLSVATLFISCNDMLDTDPRVTELTAATFPGKPADVEALNAATYSIMNTLGGGDQSGILNNPFYWWSLMSDDCSAVAVCRTMWPSHCIISQRRVPTSMSRTSSFSMAVSHVPTTRLRPLTM